MRTPHICTNDQVSYHGKLGIVKSVDYKHQSAVVKLKNELFAHTRKLFELQCVYHPTN